MPEELKKEPEKPSSAPKAAGKEKGAAATPEPITDDPIINKLREQFPEAVLEAVKLDMPTLRIAREKIAEVCQFLRDDPEAQFDFLTDLTGRHIPGAEKTYQTIYHLYSFPRNVRLRLKVDLTEEETVPSVVGVWSGADWMEREVYDLVGIRFEGHPDLRRLLLPQDWEGHPLRKEYPLLFQYNRWTAEHLNMIPFDPSGEYTGKFE
jgi:NADH-quinone oxidoreductase subunit C